jgi:hypothetical protein
VVATSETSLLVEFSRISQAMLASSVIAVGLVGCASEAHRAEPVAQQYPENYKAELLQYFPGERYVVCVRYNAKGLDGHYTGVKPGMAVFAGGRFNDFTEHPKGMCEQAEFKPFPELEKLSR